MTLYLILGGLLILTLILASIAQRYHAFIEERRRRIERVLHRVGEIEELLRLLQDLPVPVEAEKVLRSEVLARLQIVKSIHARYPGIDPMVAEAQLALSSVKARHSDRQLDESELTRLLRSLGELLWMVQERRLLSEMSEQDLAALSRAATLCRAQHFYQFHRRQAARKLADRQIHQALWHLTQIKSFLEENGPDDEQADSWRREVEEARREIDRELSGRADQSSSE